MWRSTAVASPTQIVVFQTDTPKIDVKAGLLKKIEIRSEAKERVGVNFAPVTINNGSSNLSQLPDVQFANPSQGDLVSYSQPNSKWVNIKQSTVTDGGNF
jgi:hypothetical protein